MAPRSRVGASVHGQEETKNRTRKIVEPWPFFWIVKVSPPVSGVSHISYPRVRFGE